jgi:hypothetical protein
VKVLGWRTYLHKDSTQLEEQTAEAAEVKHHSSRFVEVLEEGEVTSSVEAAVAIHMEKGVYQVGGNQEYTSVGEGAVAESRVKQQEVEELLEEVKVVAKRAAEACLWDHLLTLTQTTPPMA